MVSAAYKKTELNDEQFQVLIAAALAWQFDCNQNENEPAGYRPLGWLTADRQTIEPEVQALIQSGLLEVYKPVSATVERHFRITTAGLKLVGSF